MLAVSREQTTDPPRRELESIFRQHSSRVFATAYRTTGNAQDAEDVLQTIFLRLARRGDALDLSPDPGSYLYRAAVNAALDLMRSKARSGAVSVEQIETLPEAKDGVSPEKLQQDREMQVHLRRAVLALSPRNAEVFVMRFFEGAANRDIATTLGMSQAAVGVALHRARAQVKKELAALQGGF